MNTVQLAGSLPRDPQFREFVSQFTVQPSEVSVDQAAAFIREVCEIESRRELASNPFTERRFHKFIRRPFVAWRDRQQSLRRAA